MAAVLKVLASVLVVVVALSGPRVSAQTHHVVGGDSGWGPALDVTSWLSGRVFRVGDKIWFNYAGTEDSIVELEGPEEFQSCNLTNPIRMYTDPVSHVELEKEGTRYFTSGNLDNCKNGLKLPVPVQPPHEYGPPSHEYGPPPPFGPHPPHHPPSEFGPPPPVRPPPPAFGPPPPRPPSDATYLNGLSFVLFAGLLVCYVGM
ncbi:hypothetical protein DH2020_017214 [Rehmannia glutinosa]|uniref:Phytocyanin domain-containing protein n=1 Tax=Rehmannia glutinosa TaxID=99300 RepID=A0ABR0WTY2_REHGL